MSTGAILDSSDPRKPVRERCAVCVVGSGAGGGVVAKELAECGVDVILVEEGGYYRASDFNQREADMLPMLYRDKAAQATADLSITVLQARCVGGTTVINECICFRTPEDVLAEWREQHGVEGFSPRDLEEIFRRVEQVLHVVPIAENEVNANGLVVASGLKKLGYQSATFDHNRIDCYQCGYCQIGCVFGSHQDISVTYVPRALAAGCRLWTRARVERVLLRGGMASGVEGHFIERGTDRSLVPFRIDAQVVVLAAGAIHTPVLLIASGLDRGLPAVGRNLHLHPLAPMLARMKERIEAYDGIPMCTYSDQFRRDTAGRRGFKIESVFAKPGLASTVVPGFGEAHARIMSAYPYLAASYAQLWDTGSGTVRARGLRPVISYELSAYDQEKARRALQEQARVFLAAGAEEVFTTHHVPISLRSERDLWKLASAPMRPNDLALISPHPQGACRMGADFSTSVVNSRLEHHFVRNLYLADASVLPTATGVNPQITIMAVATKAAFGIRDRLTSRSYRDLT